jgi:O-antigen chain-terminating methyltransferase
MNAGRSGLNEFYGSEAQLRLYHARYMPFVDTTPREVPILDLACGSGVFMELAQARGRAVEGVEHAAEAAKLARAKGFSVSQDDALRFLEMKQEAFAFIYCSHLIEHLLPADARRLLELAYRALVHGGRLWINTPNPASFEVISEIFWLDPTHVRPYPLPLLANMLQRAGFEIIAQGHDNAPMLPRRTLPRRIWLRLILGRHYGHMNTFLCGEKS